MLMFRLIFLNKAWSGGEILIYPLPLRLTSIPYHKEKFIKFTCMMAVQERYFLVGLCQPDIRENITYTLKVGNHFNNIPPVQRVWYKGRGDTPIRAQRGGRNALAQSSD